MAIPQTSVKTDLNSTVQFLFWLVNVPVHKGLCKIHKEIVYWTFVDLTGLTWTYFYTIVETMKSQWLNSFKSFRQYDTFKLWYQWEHLFAHSWWHHAFDTIEKEGEEEIAHNFICMCCEHGRYERAKVWKVDLACDIGANFFIDHKFRITLDFCPMIIKFFKQYINQFKVV